MSAYALLLEDQEIKEKVEKVEKIARMFLGTPMQIVVNEFPYSASNHQGSFWTDHGICHSERVIDILDKLVEENSQRLRQPLSAKELFYLYTSAWLHDLGMYVKDPDFTTAVAHRKYHGRISGRILRRLFELYNSGFKDIPNPWGDNIQELNITIVLCEAHQSYIRLQDIKDMPDNYDAIRISLLAAFLSLADALDITIDRAPESFYQFFETYLYQPTEMSQFEWIVNQCVEGKEKKIVDISIPHKLKDKYKMLLKSAGDRYYDSQRKMGIEKLKTYIKEYIRSYVNKHLKQVDVPNVKACFEDDKSIKIPESIFTPSSSKSRRPHKFDWVWPDYFERHDIPTVVRTMIDKIKQEVFFDDFHIFIFDKLSSSITYWNAPNLEYFRKNFTDKERHLLRRTKVPLKCGIVGFQAYLGMPEVVDDIYHDPRLVFGGIDEKLRLESVILFPILKGLTLFSVFMWNRRRHDKELKVFKQEDFKKIGSFVMDKEFVTEYYDSFKRIRDGKA